MNYLEMSLPIVTLRSHGWSLRRIARELRIHRATLQAGLSAQRIYQGLVAEREFAGKRVITERGADWLLDRTRLIGKYSGTWTESLYRQRA